MWLAIDIGNSRIKGGWFEESGGNDPVDTFQIGLDSEGSEAVYRRVLNRRLGDRTIHRIGLSSVVPPVSRVLEGILQEATGVQPERIRVDMCAPITLRYETPETLGIDRFAAAAAGFHAYSSLADGTARPVVVVDAGTAVNYEVIDSNGGYRGGMIAPGPALMLEALSRKTAQLPSAPLELPEQPIGRSTVEAMQSGIMVHCIEGIRGALRRLSDELDGEPVVVLTGGWADHLREHLPEVDHVDRHLVLKGVALLLACD